MGPFDMQSNMHENKRSMQQEGLHYLAFFAQPRLEEIFETLGDHCK